MRRAALLLGILALGVAMLWVLLPESPPEATEMWIAPPRAAEGILSSPELQERIPAVDAARPAISAVTEAGEESEHSVGVEAHRIVVLDARGDPVPSAVAVQETQDGHFIGFPADAQGWVEIPSVTSAEVTTVMAAGFLPETLHGIRQEERVLLERAIRVQIQITDGWGRLAEGFPGLSLTGGFEAHLEPADLDPWEDAPLVELRSGDGSESHIRLTDIEAVLHSSVSASGLATFRVAKPGEYGVTIIWQLAQSKDGEERFVCTMQAEPLEIMVRSGVADQYFEVRIPLDNLDLFLDLVSGLLDD